MVQVLHNAINKQLLFLAFHFLLFSPCLWAQNLGHPLVKNYHRNDYRAGTENWAIGQDERGVIYFANHDGLLEYDGSKWRTYKVDNKTRVRSLLIRENLIYVGAQNDFGYFKPDVSGKLQYHSLKDSIPEVNRSFEDVWRIFNTPDSSIYFNTDRYIFRYDRDGKIHIITPKSGTFEFLSQNSTTSQLYVYENKQGLWELEMGQLLELHGGDPLRDKNVTAVLSLEQNTLLVATETSGFYIESNAGFQPWDVQANEIASFQIFCVRPLKEGNFVVGTRFNGVYIIDKAGKILQHVNKSTGLQNDHVRSLFEDNLGNIWVGLNNGIDYIEKNSPFSRLHIQSNFKTIAYCSAKYQGYLYLGTAEGVFYKHLSKINDPLDESGFSFVEGSKGEVRTLMNLGGALIMGHHQGTFVIRGGSAQRISDAQGGWTYIILPDHPNYMVGGTYDGLTLYKKKLPAPGGHSQWEYLGKIDTSTFNESSRFLEYDTEQNLWMSHIYKGVYKLRISDDWKTISGATPFQSESGFKDDLFINAFKVNEAIVFGTPHGIYSFDYGATESPLFFDNQELFKGEFKDRYIQKLVEDDNKNVWYIANDSLGFMNYMGNGRYKPLAIEDVNFFNKLSGQFVRDFEHINPYEEGKVIFGTPEGFIHYTGKVNYEDLDYSFNVLIRKVEVSTSERRIVFDGTFVDADSNIIKEQHGAQALFFKEFPSNLKSIKITYAATCYIDPEKTQYSYKLEGFDEEWSDWTTSTEKEYTNLDAGKTYRFLVKAKNVYDKEVTGYGYSFSTKYSWWRNILIISAVLAVISIIWYWRKSTKVPNPGRSLPKREKRQEAIEEFEELWGVIIDTKEKYLEAASAIIEAHRQEKPVDKKTLTSFKDSVKKINDEDNWEEFMYLIRKRTWFKNFQKTYPGLRDGEYKYAVLARAGYSNKKAAYLMKRNERTIEGYRHRLRQEFGLGRDDDLTAFLLRF